MVPPGLISSVIALLILIAIVVGIVRAVSGKPAERAASSDRSPVAMGAGRFIAYAISFAALMGFLFAVSNLIGLIVAETFFRSQVLLSADEVRTQVSYDLAALIVSTPLWFGLWRLAGRGIQNSAEERQAPERRLYLALAFGVTAVVSLFALHTALRVIFTLPAIHDTQSALHDGISAAIRLIVYGGAWLAYTRLAFRERAGSEADPARDLALYVLSAFSLVFLAIGLLNAGAAILDQLLGLERNLLIGDTPSSTAVLWGGIAAWVVSGGAVWGVLSRYDDRYPAVRFFRIPYLYIVVGVSALVTLGSSTDLLYELLRRAFGYHESSSWSFLHDVLPVLLVAGVFWAYHWLVLRRQSVLQAHPGLIAWPRRPYLAALSFVGLAIAAPAAVSLLWLVLDALFKSNATLSGGAWWRDGLSLSVAALLIGAVVWLGPWSILQRVAGDTVERAAQARRRLLGAIVLISSLIGLGFLIALLWLTLGILLGGSHDTEMVSNIAKFLSATLVGGALAAYYGLILRADLRLRPTTRRIQLAVLLAPGGDAALARLRGDGYDATVLGYLTEDPAGAMMPIVTVEETLRTARTSRALLILTGDTGLVYPYTRRLPAGVVPAQDSQALAITSSGLN
ncbi:MAG TPA: DUF5671 domain-containing protein [Chloroflexota bacterium]